MPILESNYKPSIFFRNGFIATVYSGLYRKVKGVEQQRERIILSDNDFLDLDWSYSAKKSSKLVIMLHGLEGDGQRPYMLGVSKLFNDNGFTVVCVNFRGCSGETNLKYRSYHSGATDDLSEVIDQIIKKDKYDSIYLKGISLGANVLLKYIGERSEVPKQLKGAVAVSVPCSLKGSSAELHKFKNLPFSINFLIYLKKRLKLKVDKFPNKISHKDIRGIKSLMQLDDVYTSKAHGFNDAFDYYEKCSSLQFLDQIKIPTLIINALNDSFLSEDCYPYAIAESHPYVHLETPKYGGHVGFITSDNVYYNEKRALEFISKN